MTTYSYSLSTPASETQSWVKDLFVVLGASIIIALFGQVRIPLPFTPVPIATQGSVILFLSVLLGRKRAALAVLAFITQGVMGLPVFSGTMCGLAIFAGPTGGYIVGYILGAYVTGLIVERLRQTTSGSIFAAMALGNLVIFVCGAAWLSTYVGISAALLLGVAPFIAGDALKLVIALRGLKALKFF